MLRSFNDIKLTNLLITRADWANGSVLSVFFERKFIRIVASPFLLHSLFPLFFCPFSSRVDLFFSSYSSKKAKFNLKLMYPIGLFTRLQQCTITTIVALSHHQPLILPVVTASSSSLLK